MIKELLHLGLLVFAVIEMIIVLVFRIRDESKLEIIEHTVNAIVLLTLYKLL